jgi:peptide/nickel transport system permease protein
MKETISHSPGWYIKKRFMKNKLAVFGMGFIILCVIISILGYLILPDGSPNSNEMCLQLNMIHPMSSVKVLKIRKNKEIESSGFFNKMFFGSENPYTIVPINDYQFNGDSLIADVYTGLKDKKLSRVYSLPEIIYPLDDNNTINLNENNLSFQTVDGKILSASVDELKKEIIEKNISKKTFIFGTDEFGRDLFSRLLLGTRISLFVGLIAVIISLFLGITLGSMAGFFRGKVDSAIMWLTNVVWSIPTLLLVIAINLALGKELWVVFVAVGLTMWVDVARLARGQIFVVREMEFVEAGRALGFHNFRIITKHVLPNIMGPLIVITASNFASAILLEAGLSFLGMGVQPPMPSWGGMIKEYYGYIIFGDVYLAMIPGCAIILLVLAFNFVGNGLRDALDVKM